MICHQLWCNSEHSTMKKNSTMKIWQWKWQQWKFDNENGNNENLTMKIQQWKWQQWKFDNENSYNENLTMKMQQWKCQQWKMPTMKMPTMKNQQWNGQQWKSNNENGRSQEIGLIMTLKSLLMYNEKDTDFSSVFTYFCQKVPELGMVDHGNSFFFKNYDNRSLLH